MTREHTQCLFWLIFVITTCEGLLQQVCRSDNAVLGTEINLDDLEDNSASYEAITDMIKGALVANGVVVIRNQTMDRVGQCNFTRNLGPVIILPESFEGKDPEPGLRAIQRVTNYFDNGTWKGVGHCFGCYWHKDGDFHSADYIASVLYAERVVGPAAATMFLDNCAAYDLIPPGLKARIQDTVFWVSVRDIPDFKNGTEEDFALFPDSARHPIFYTHPGSGRRCLYMTNTMRTLRPKSAAEMRDLQRAWDIMVTQAPKYRHYWVAGDVVIWDNLAVMHRAGEKRPGYSPRDPRILFRTQYRISNYY
ncbi:family dioxygenase [Paramuricea clavata]|uniref:Family dioxygenase n=1 Tax=Paramuricea clavata TaxID=317549 RepID=A0A6S7GAQ0_PARCT|nr:family dioxygenase [Paramuricea clavata]